MSTLNQNHLSMMCAGPSEHDGTSTPEVYGFCDSQGTFHAFEGPDGRKMVMVMKALEEKILGQVEKTLVGMRHEIQQNKSKSEAQSWMLKNIVAEQKDLSTRIETLSVEAFESRLDLIAQIDEVSREGLESRSDLIARTDEISHEAFESRLDCLTSLDDLERQIGTTHFEQDIEEVPTTKPGEAELEFLEQHRAKISDLVAKLEDKVKVSTLLSSLQNAVTTATTESAAKSEAALHQEMTEESTAKSDATLHQETTEKSAAKSEAAPNQADEVSAKPQTAYDLDMASSGTLKELKNLGTPSPWPGLRAAEFSYSDKTSLGGEFYGNTMKMSAPPSMAFNKKSGLGAASFSLHRPRPVSQMTSSQSMPFLAPLF